MTDTQKKPIWKNELVWLFLITSGLFALLYSKFLLGGFAYVFTDCGADTLQINYAQYEMFSSLFRRGDSGYILQAGLGMDVSSYYPAYLIPYNLSASSCTAETSAVGSACICISETADDISCGISVLP